MLTENATGPIKFAAGTVAASFSAFAGCTPSPARSEPPPAISSTWYRAVPTSQRISTTATSASIGDAAKVIGESLSRCCSAASAWSHSPRRGVGAARTHLSPAPRRHRQRGGRRQKLSAPVLLHMVTDSYVIQAQSRRSLSSAMLGPPCGTIRRKQGFPVLEGCWRSGEARFLTGGCNAEIAGGLATVGKLFQSAQLVMQSTSNSEFRCPDTMQAQAPAQAPVTQTPAEQRESIAGVVMDAMNNMAKANAATETALISTQRNSGRQCGDQDPAAGDGCGDLSVDQRSAQFGRHARQGRRPCQHDRWDVGKASGALEAAPGPAEATTADAKAGAAAKPQGQGRPVVAEANIDHWRDGLPGAIRRGGARPSRGNAPRPAKILYGEGAN